MKMATDGSVSEFANVPDVNCAVEGQDGLVYAGTSTGKVLKIAADGSISVFYDMANLHGSSARVHAITQVNNGDFYVVGSTYTVDKVLADGSHASTFNTGHLSYITNIDQSEDGGFYVSRPLDRKASKLNSDGSVITDFFKSTEQIQSFMIGRDGYYYALARKKILKIDPGNKNIIDTFGSFNMSLGMVRTSDGDFYVADDSRFYINKVSREYAVSIDEFTPKNTVIAMVETIDPNGDALTYKILSGNGLGAFSMNSKGEIVVADDMKLDHSKTPTFKLEVVANDGVHSSQIEALTINLKPINTHAPVITPGQVFTVLEHANVGVGVGTVQATDSDGPVLLDWKIVSGNTNGTFTIDSKTGEITVKDNTMLDGTVLSFNLGITVSDITHTSAIENVKIDLVLINHPPTFDKGPDIEISEDAGSQTISGWATNITRGRPLESSQSISFKLTPDLPTLFTALPAVSTSGTLTFKTAPDANGLSNLEVVLKDDGGALNGGQDTSSPQQFIIRIKEVNDAPTFSLLSDSVLIDYGTTSHMRTNWAINIDPGATNEASQNLTFEVINDNNNLFVVNPYIDVQGHLYFEVADQMSGISNVTVLLKDDGGTLNGGIDRSTPATFTIKVKEPPTHPPTVIANQVFSVVEGSSTGTMVGKVQATDLDPNTTFQDWKIKSGNANNTFLIDDKTGEITVFDNTRLDGSIQSFALIVVVGDGQHVSADETTTINILLVNDQPTFTKGPRVEILEDSGPQVINGWATNISAGSPAESGQALTFSLTADKPSLFSQTPALKADGTLMFEPARDANGTTNISVVLKDDGGIANGGVDTSPRQTFEIFIAPVNDAPSFMMSSAIIEVENGAKVHQIANWITGISPGPSDEASQRLSFQLSTDNQSLFTDAPKIDDRGNLSFEVADQVAGQAVAEIVLVDDGGTMNGGKHQSDAYKFTIQVNKIPQFIDFSPISDQRIGKPPVNLIATGGDSGNPVTFTLETSPADGVAHLMGETILLDGTGKVTVRANQEGNELYAAAEEVVVAFEIKQSALFLPTLFSPNGDANNDYFILRGASNISQIEFSIYDRYGKRIFYSNDIQRITREGWDGYFGGQKQPVGNYKWILNGSYQNGEPLNIDGKNSGTVRLIR
ncbi:MAG: cadherin domain-containing protein [Cytophagales bacterium]|nr:cadherin domain-containing protein [Cytophagales bacterium]